MTIVFSSHASWRAVECHGESVCLDQPAEEIASTLVCGWSEVATNARLVTTRSGHRFVVVLSADGPIVLTALRRKIEGERRP